MSITASLKLEVVVPLDTDPVGLSNACVAAAESSGVSLARLQLDGRRTSPGRLNMHLRAQPHFCLEAGPFEADLSRISSHGLGYLTVAGIDENSLVRCADMICTGTTMVSVRWYDGAYDYWQNADDLAMFTEAGRSLDGLLLRPNNLPPPLDGMVVDTSRNPGRLILRDGYVEAIGHRMWLGSEFLRRVPDVGRQSILAASWLRVTEREHGILDLVAHEEPFRDESTSDIQDRLRRLLFPATIDLRSTKQGHHIDHVQ